MANELAVINTGWLAQISGDLDKAVPVAEMMAKSDLVPKQFKGKPYDIIIAAAHGRGVGLNPLQSLSAVAVINGRPCIWGDAMLGICQSHPQWGGSKTQWITDTHCKVTVFRNHGSTASEYVGEFSEADAKRAGLWSKQGPWSQYPKRMLEIRARAFALRNGFSDALAGMQCREEVEDMREVEATVYDDSGRRGRKPRIVQPSEPYAAAAPAHIIDAVAEPVVDIVPPTQPAIEEVIDAEEAEALAEFRKTLASASKRFSKSKVKEIMEGLCGHTIEKAEDVDRELRGKVIEALCAMEG